jgi:hypothetical protein
MRGESGKSQMSNLRDLLAFVIRDRAGVEASTIQCFFAIKVKNQTYKS